MEKNSRYLNKCAVPKFRVDKRSVRDQVGIPVYKHKKKLQAEEKATGISPVCTHFFNQQGNIPLLHLEISFSCGWVFIREGKLFIRRVRKTTITRPIYFGASRTNSSSPVISSIRHKQSISWTFLIDVMATIFCERNAEESH